MGKLTIDISDELLKLFPSKQEAKSEAKQAMVFDLVRRGKISKGKAAELLGISLWNLPELLAQHDIPWFDYSASDSNRITPPFDVIIICHVQIK